MLARFSLGILFAVLVAASRPASEGGARDLLAVGVRYETVENGKTVRRLALGVPDGKAREAYERLIRSRVRDDLLRGNTVFAPAPKEGDAGPRILEFVYYGHGSRAGRAPIAFTAPADGDLPGGPEAFAAAREIAGLPGPVTAAAARVLVESEDLASYRDALEALAGVQPDFAVAEAVRTARDVTAPVARRLIAVRALKSLGGAKVHPAAFAGLALDPNEEVRAAAK